MISLFALFAPLALLLPLAAQDEPASLEQPHTALDPEVARLPAASQSAGLPDSFEMEAIPVEPVQNQVRIERRITVRIAPRAPVAGQSLLADLPQRALPPRFVERKMDDCVPVASIAGVQTGSGNRLLLYLRDRRVVSANLEKSCRARDFYSGFYVERNSDGMLCVDRDKLQSRAGANCEVRRMGQLVPARD